jgi:hypothetical protein
VAGVRLEQAAVHLGVQLDPLVHLAVATRALPAFEELWSS